MWYGVINLVLGVWLGLAPLVAMDLPSVKLNNLLMGVIAAVVSGYTPVKKSGECWPALIAGIWLAFSSSFRFFVEGNGYLWNNCVCGILISVSGLLVMENFPAQKPASR